MPEFDSSPACLPGLCFWLPGPVRWLVSRAEARRGLSVLARVVSRRAYGSWTTPGLGEARVFASPSVAFPWGAFGRRPVIYLFEARFLARRCLCLRFTRYLAAPSARLEVKMVRYSFLVGLFHPRLHAGLSRRLRSLTVAALLLSRDRRKRFVDQPRVSKRIVRGCRRRIEPRGSHAANAAALALNAHNAFAVRLPRASNAERGGL